MPRKQKRNSLPEADPVSSKSDYVTFELEGVVYEVKREHLRAIRRAIPRSPVELRRLYLSRETWDHDELLRLNLPEYWSREWLEAQLSRLTVSNLAVFARISRSTVTKWRKIHGIEDQLPDQIREAWATGEHRSYRALADSLGVSESVVSAALGQSRRSHNPELDERLRRVEEARARGAASPKGAHEMLPDLSYQQVYRAWRRLPKVPKE